MTQKMMPPKSLRDLCEPIMEAVGKHDHSSQTIIKIEALERYLRSCQFQDVVPSIEYVTLPFFFLIPNNANEVSQVPERIAESALDCFTAMIDVCRDTFGKREDLFFPVLVRIFAILTVVQEEPGMDTIIAPLKEETKLSAIHTLHALLKSIPSSSECIPFVDDNAVFHMFALLLDLALKERAKHVREAALICIHELILHATLTQMDFIFPGCVSRLGVIGQSDFKAGSEIPRLAIVAMTECIKKGLKAEGDNTTTLTMDKLFLLINGLWHGDSEESSPIGVRCARIRLITMMLQDFQEKIHLKPVYLQVLIRKLVAGCADSVAEVSSLAQESFKQNLSEYEQVDAKLQTLLVACLVSLRDISAKEDESILCARLGMCNFLINQMEPLKVQTVFITSLVRIVWSLIITFQCNPTRFDQMGRIEFNRLTLSLTRSRANELLQFVSEKCPSVARTIQEMLLESVESYFTLRHEITTSEEDSFAKQSGSNKEEEDDSNTLTLPHSFLPSALVLASRLASVDSSQSFLSRLIDMDQLWSVPTKVHKNCTPQQAKWNCMLLGAALECVSTLAMKIGLQFKYSLVDVLFPVLQCVGSESPGVKLCAESCLKTISTVCGYTSDSKLLQENVDYIVDALMRRVPHFHAKDVGFANVIEALIERIPVWVPNSTTFSSSSPWIKDLVETILTGLDDRFTSPQVAWSLLRIAQAVVMRGVTSVAMVGAAQQQDEKTLDETKRVEKTTNKKSIHDSYVEEALKDLTMFTDATTLNDPSSSSSNTKQHKSTSSLLQDNEEEEEEEDEIHGPGEEEDDDSSDAKQIYTAIESILIKSAVFLSEEDVLVRQQAAKVATECIHSLSKMNPEKSQQIIVRIWPSLVDQIKHERNPAVLSLLLSTIQLAMASKEGREFFSRRFADEVWPALESVLERNVPSANNKRRQGRYSSSESWSTSSSRDLELTRRVLISLKMFEELLALRAERIALVTSKYLDASFTKTIEGKELKSLACEVWFALAQHAGDTIWLSVAACLNKYPMMNTRSIPFVLTDSTFASKLWTILESN